MQGMTWDFLWASGGATGTVQFNVPPNYYVIAEGALNQISDTSSAVIGIMSYTPADGIPVNLNWPNWAISIWDSGILSVTFGIYPFGAYASGIANVFLW